MKGRYLLFLAVVLPLAGWSQHFSSRGLTYRAPQVSWEDSVMQTLSLDQRIAQLLIARVPTKMDDGQAARFADEMAAVGIGGVCFFAGTSADQVRTTRLLRERLSLPPIVSIDGEWGLGMRLKDLYSFPRNARFGLLSPQADSLVFHMGQEVGLQCRMMGIHINFAPVVDVNTNPLNPVIGTRAYGSDPERVAHLAALFVQGQQSQGVMAVAKHFPGHGDTEKDSHRTLPVINHSRAYIDSVDLFPFRRVIEAGVGGVMVAHLRVNAVDSTRPSSLSPAVVSGLLRGELGFDGLVVTDGLDMRGITNGYEAGEAALAALLAGNDLLLLPPDIGEAVKAIHAAALASDSVRRLVDFHCRRVLRVKHRLVLPTGRQPLTVPDSVRTAVCNAIVSDLNLNTDRRIDSIVDAAIAAGAMPGCQVAVVHNGRLVLNRAYGRLSYDSAAPAVSPSTYYDLASLTKVCATTLAVMKLVDDGRLSLDDRLSRYLDYLRVSDKKNITVQQALSHCARLKAFDALWQKTVLPDSVFLLIAQSQLNPSDAYCYSDFGFLLLGDLVQSLSGETLDDYVANRFYRPMGLSHITFRPLEHGVDTLQIAPTETDSLRGQIRGVVHDPNAYVVEGHALDKPRGKRCVAGHAGLFATAADVAALMQMVLDGGVYNGRRYLRQQTVETFTSRHYAHRNNRRALGFDKPLFDPSGNGPTSPLVSQASFGHTGFTGTMVWADPERRLVYVFLSNRVCPSATPNLLARMNVRTDIQSLIYNDIIQ